MEGMEGIYTNGDGLDVAKLVERLKGYDVDFDETEYARENKELYDDAKASDYLWRFKLPGTLTAEEQTDSETIENYEGAKTNHERNKRAAQGLLAMVTELEENHGRCMERTEGFRKESLPLKALLTAYAYTFVENPGEEQKHVLRFLLPVTDQNIKEELALSFTYYLSNSLQGRDAQVRAGEILGCKYVDLVYSEDIADRAQTLILNTNDAVEKSVLAKAGAEINIQYIGGVPQHGR